MLKEFRAFLFRGNIVDLAVAVVIAGAFGAVIKSFTDNVLMQIVAYIVGKPNFGDLNIGKIHIGLFLNDVITFVIVAAAIFFFVIKPIQMAQARRAAGQAAPEDVPAGPTQEELLAEIRDLLKARGA